MMGITHTAIAIAGATAITASNSPELLLLAALGSQLPDIDTTKSWAGKALYPIAALLEERFAHRSFTHSYLFSAGLLLLCLPLLIYRDWKYWVALPLGHFLSCRADCFTKSGVMLFYPSPVICVAGRNPKLRLATGTPAEYTVLALAIAFWLISANIVSAGGLSQQMNQAIFPNVQTAAEVYQKHPAQAVYVDVKGTHTRTGNQVNQKFRIITANDDAIIGLNDLGKLYKIGTTASSQINPKSIKASVSGTSQTQTRQQDILEADADAWLSSLPVDAFVSGELNIEDGGEIQKLPESEGLPTITAGEVTKLDHARPAEIKAAISGYWINRGQVVIRTVKEKL